MLGNALARNPAPGFAEINISGNDLGGDAAVAWAGGDSPLLPPCTHPENRAAMTAAAHFVRVSCCLLVVSGLGNLRKSSLVFLDLRNCGMVESGSTAVLEALLPQSKSLGTLKISGNRLQTHGTTRLSEIISAEPLVLQVIG